MEKDDSGRIVLDDADLARIDVLARLMGDDGSESVLARATRLYVREGEDRTAFFRGLTRCPERHVHRVELRRIGAHRYLFTDEIVKIKVEG